MDLEYKDLAKRVATYYSDDSQEIESLAETALKEVERARKAYDKRWEGKEPEYKFSTYLTYYFKKAIEEVLEK